MAENKLKNLVVLIVLTISIGIGLPAGAEQISWRGKLQTDYLGLWLEGLPFSETSVGQLNLGLTLQVTPSVSAEVEGNILQLAGGNSSTLVDLNRLYFRVRQPQYNLSLGKQPLSWGAGVFFNPADPFAGLTDPLTGRLGTAPSFSGLTVDFVTGKTSGISAFHLVEANGLTGAKYQTKSKNTHLIGAITAESGGANLQALLQIKSDLGAGWFAQAALTHLDTKNPALRWAVGGDYAVNGKLTIRGELSNTGADLGLPGLVIVQSNSADSISAAISAQYAPAKSTTYTVSLLSTPQEETLLLLPAYTTQLADDLDLRVYGLISSAPTDATAIGGGIVYNF